MSIFSKTCKYAMRAVFHIAPKTEVGGKVGVKEIALGINLSKHSCLILQNLCRRGLINKQKGQTMESI